MLDFRHSQIFVLAMILGMSSHHSLGATPAAPTPPVLLCLADRHLRGQTQIDLTQELFAAYPDQAGGFLRQARSVRIDAKSKLGLGRIQLAVGQSWRSPDYPVPGRLTLFENDHETSFTAIEIPLPKPDRFTETESWILVANDDDIVIRRIILVQDESSSEPAFGDSVTLTCECPFGGYRTCRAPGEILSATLEKENSPPGRCEKDQTWGFTKNRLWIDGGCAGVFRVIVKKEF